MNKNRNENLEKKLENFITFLKNNNINECEKLLKNGLKYLVNKLFYSVEKENHGLNVDMNKNYENNHTLLMKAVLYNDYNICKLLIKYESNVNIQNNKGKTALMYASRKNNLDICKLLIENKADVNRKDKEGYSALFFAIDYFYNKSFNNTINLSCCKLLIDKGADINIQSNEGFSILMQAILTININLCNFLIKKGVDINLQYQDGSTALMIAININKEEIVNLLIESKANLELKDKFNQTALYLACEQVELDNLQIINNLSIVKQLLDNGANVYVQNYEGNTPFIISVKKNNREKCIMLLENIKNTNNINNIYTQIKYYVNIQNNKGYSALMYCVENKPKFKLFDLLIDYGADINLLNDNNDNALYISIKKNNFFYINELIELGADLTVINFEGNNILLLLIFYLLYKNNENKILNIFKTVILTSNQNINLINHNGYSALILAVIKDSEAIVNILLENNIDINLQDSNGDTALNIAIKQNKIKISKILIEKNANIDIENYQGETALQLAQNFNLIELVLLMKKINLTEYINNFIRDIISTYKKNHLLEVNDIFTFFYKIHDYLNINNLTDYSHLDVYTTKRKQELKKLIHNFKKKGNNSLYQKIKIVYNKENGINATGVSREFYDNLETEINLKIKAKEEIYLKKNILENELKKNLKYYTNINNTEKIKNISNKISDLENEIIKLDFIIQSPDEFDIKDILVVLAISKINGNSIFYLNDEFKNLVLFQITDSIEKKIEKNVIFNSLEYISLDTPGELITKNKKIGLFINKEIYQNFLVEKEIYNYENIKKMENNYVKLLLKNNNQNIIASNDEKNRLNNKNIKLSFLKKDNIKEIEKEIVKNKRNNRQLLKIIDIYIEEGFYKDYYDFYLSHFVQSKINLESFLKNLKFKLISSLMFPTIEIENSILSSYSNKFIHLFQNLDENELYLFNKLISGTTFKLQKEYKIIIIMKDYYKPWYIQTCFNRIDIYSKKWEEENLFDKERFITFVKNTLKEGFTSD